MRDLLQMVKFVKAWALVTLISRLVFIIAILAFVFGGGEIHIQWGS
jgi:hypothetical protein